MLHHTSISTKCFLYDSYSQLSKAFLSFLFLLLSCAGAFSQGELWGMTRMGGSDGLGVIFKTNGDGTGIASQFEFKGEIVGRAPSGELTLGNNGKWYGMAAHGGKYDLGVLFEYDRVTNSYLRKVDFTGTSNGRTPLGSLTLGGNGKLYGLTYFGGESDRGVLFEYDPSTGVLTKKIDFSNANGAFPQGSLKLASNGKLYGMAYFGGDNFKGVLFEYDLGTSILITQI